MPDPVLTEQQVRDRLEPALDALLVRMVLASPGNYPRILAMFGVRWTGEHYVEVTDV